MELVNSKNRVQIKIDENQDQPILQTQRSSSRYEDTFKYFGQNDDYEVNDIPFYKYTIQENQAIVEKLSNKGWSTNKRILKLDKYYLSYARLAKDYGKQNDREIEPKQQLLIHKISKITFGQDEQKKNSKLKNGKNYFSVSFQADAIVQPKTRKNSIDSKKSLQQTSDQKKENQKDQKAEKKQTESQKWFFIFDQDQEMHNFISQIYINILSSIQRAKEKRNKAKLEMSAFIDKQQSIEDKALEEMKENKILMTSVFNFINDQKYKGLPVVLFKYADESLQKSEYTEDNIISSTQNLEDQHETEQDSDDQKEFEEVSEHQEKQTNLDYLSDESVDQDSDYKQLLQQNLSIQNRLNNFHSNQNYTTEQYILNDDEAKVIQANIENRHRDQQNLEKNWMDKEKQGWDLLFQNYWGYIIAAESNEETQLKICEKLFKHVGEFSQKASSHFQKIVDILHKPKDDDWERKHHQLGLQEFHKPDDQLNIYKDSEEQSLYHDHLNDQGKIDFNEIFSMKDTAIYLHQNIVYMLTNQYEAKDILCQEELQTKLETSSQAGARQNSVSALKKTGVDTSVSVHRKIAADTLSVKSKNESDSNKKKDGQIKNRQTVSKWKLFGRQFLSMDVLFQALYDLSKQNFKLQNDTDKNNFNLRIPLSTLIDYKGFRCLAIAKIPTIADTGPAHGFKQENFSFEPKLKNLIAQVGKVMKLKKQTVYKENPDREITQNEAHISYFLKIYSSSVTNKNLDQNQDKKLQHHFEELQYMDTDLYYIMRSQEIFPYDLTIKDNNFVDMRPKNVLRPEYTCDQNFELSADEYKSYVGLKGIKPIQENDQIILQSSTKNQSLKATQQEITSDLQLLNLASLKLKTQKIDYLVQVLDGLISIPIDSECLEQLLHDEGVNIRYLSFIACKSQIPHVQSICINEMVARTCKNIINRQMAELILENRNNYKKLIDKQKIIEKQIKEIQKSSQSHKLKKEKNQEKSDNKEEENVLIEHKLKVEEIINRIRQKDMDKKCQKFLVDIFNLIFGKGKETDDFWEQILFKKLKKTFNLEEAIQTAEEKYEAQGQSKIKEILNKKQINLNALFYALIYHLGITINPQPENQNKIKFSDEKKSDASNPKQQSADSQLKEPKNNEQQSILKKHVINQKKDSNQQDEQVINQNKDSNQEAKIDFEKYLDKFFIKFDKASHPFGIPKENYKIFKISPRCKTFRLQKTPYYKLIQDMQYCLQNYQIGKALEYANKKKLMYSYLHGKIDLISLADFAEIALEQGYYDKAIEYAKDALEEVLPLHAKRIRFYCILIRAYFHKGQYIEMNKSYQMAMDAIYHHLGPTHPLHITVNGIIANLFVSKGKMKDAEIIYKSSLICCMRSIGPNHIETGQLHMDLGYFYVKKDDKESALPHFEQAYFIFKFYHEKNKENKDNEDNPKGILIKKPQLLGDAAMQVAIIMEEQNRDKEAQQFIDLAYIEYDTVYKEIPDAEITILALWLKIQIQFAQQGRGDPYAQKGEKKEDFDYLCQKLIEKLITRDKAKADKEYQNKKSDKFIKFQYGKKIKKLIEETEDEISQIKVLCIATHIIQHTRSLTQDKKQQLENYCDYIMLKNKDDENNEFRLKTLIANKKNHSGMRSIRKISIYQFEDEGQKFLGQIYNDYLDKQKTESKSFKEYYQNKVLQAVDQIKSKKETEKNGKQAETTKKTDKKQDDEDDSINKEIQNKRNNPLLDQNQEDILLFFEQLLDAFYQINFYNLLVIN